MDDVTRRKVLGLVGLGARGRLVVIGVEQVRIAAQKGTVQMALVASDVSRHSLDKVVPVLKARRVEMVEWPSAAELGGAVGRETTAAIGIVDQALARGIRGAVAGATPAGDATRVSR
ncbi:ribosomal protein L7Ae/L30e/S12e/Gadd45 family protein [Gemmatimonas aurantiaca T-27]|uniref:Ribosomal protein L7Ae/L30e/S12e/Gadd45 family protein n=1 Tax=Gemmatimonas aurantiaca (strain DSM 14586 / JCM 11422 / NBRC 100505 / T-27) TaxID=379066 RepID=C1A8N7_GEMAT|nr:ribosomal protein L7Ae/L30e/S12e/Gadd45 family protein [Gemmatimonas aurantiaca T-27]